MSNTVLFVTHRKKQCGVYEFGINTFNAIKKSGKYNFIHAACESLEELNTAIATNKPEIIIYNYHIETNLALYYTVLYYLPVIFFSFHLR
jgi:hypothetical protein